MSFIDLLEKIPDPRESWKVKHNLSTLLFTTLCGVLCGAESWSDIADFCDAKKGWLSQYVDLNNGIPSAWTFRRIFTLLEPELLEWLLRTHAASLVDKENQRHIAIDGKSLRGSKRHNLKCLHSVSAMCHEHGLVLAEMGVSQKSNEITAIPLLLDLLNLNGNTVTIDAASCQHAIAQKIIEKRGDYVLALKKNHPKLFNNVQTYCKQNIINADHRLKDYFDNSHGRRVRRRYFACGVDHIEGAKNWAGIKSITALETISSQDNDLNHNVTAEWRYYISSHSADNLDLPSYIRHHWSIENKLHWVLDVNLKEDSDQKAERRSAKAFAVLKRIALNIFRIKDSNSKRSLRRRFKCAGWDNNYLLNLLK